NGELIQTFPGPRGIFSLAKPAGQITLLDIISAVDGPMTISNCLEDPEDSALQVTCPVRSHWEKLQDLISMNLNGST
ncbi:MAG: AsnC family transcriptional regulator, partial [candidate division Zixibacteria bacterium]|nr:Rrf2 family transcriptional regulator [candidate division Zixibacteria bacterium]NIS48146.1 Rrf2 family transcriptional regulator [candidate division Zixibacteria bacterium]NIU15698.1 Rrf2 family transcriptional regulator [candidate division Zixibacteria bacterium]NIV08393.1 AsnC family transcriptional regulator [candidate division Zixibacteria bacterium]NIW49298.1 AsnC family transcriptional regulator [Gammaproteobacteria bacterium]